MTKAQAREMSLQGIIDRHAATIKRMEDVHTNDEIEKQNLLSQYHQKCQYCEKLERELAIEKSKNQVHQDYIDALSRKGPLVSLNVSGHVDINKDDQETGVIDLPAKPHVTPVSTVAPPPNTETFFDRLKAIIRLAASKNGQTIECRAKGHASTYIYNINADCFCKAVDVLASEHTDKLSEFLGGNLHNTQVTKICFFLGYVLKLNIINDASLQFVDLLFAFEAFYPSKLTIQKKLSNISPTTQQRVFFGAFEGLLHRFNS